jgi:hypothetical protein
LTHTQLHTQTSPGGQKAINARIGNDTRNDC